MDMRICMERSQQMVERPLLLHQEVSHPTTVVSLTSPEATTL
jgi:hypothetical protein